MVILKRWHCKIQGVLWVTMALLIIISKYYNGLFDVDGWEPIFLTTSFL